MADAGIVLMESTGNEVYKNTVRGAEFGIRLVTGANNNKIYDNKFEDISGGEINESSLRLA